MNRRQRLARDCPPDGGLAGFRASLSSEPKRDIHHRFLLASHGCIKATRGSVFFLGPQPSFAAAKLTATSKQSPQELSSNALPLMRRSHPNLIHPELGRFVGMNVVHSGGHADDLLTDNRNRHVMSWVGEVLGGPAWIDCIVEDVRRDTIEDRGIVAP
jgi:hypothetical protein